jgi:hypothetical protein
MTDDALSFLDDTARPAPEPAAQPEPAPEPVAAPQGEVIAAPPAAPETHSAVPLTALLDEREKRQQAMRELDELKRWKAEQEAKTQQPKPIDLIEDPEGFARQQEQRLQTAIMQDRYERSLDAAREKHGEDKVKEVIAFFNDPRHAPKSAEFARMPDPFRAAFRYYDEQRDVEQIRTVGGIAALQAKIEAEVRERLLAEMQSSAPKPATPPPSLSSAASPGASKAPPKNGFEATFGA